MSLPDGDLLMFIKIEGAHPRYQSDIISLPHGFSTRHGGVSRGEYTQTLNFAYGRGDTDETVVKNFELFAESIGAEPHNGIMLGQIHSTEVLTVTESEFGEGIYRKSERCLDGYVSSVPGALLCVRVADCVPILFADETARVIGAVHSGWRGSVGRIAVACIEKMTSLGAVKGNIKAAIGPSICGNCYEVGADFVDECRNRLGDALCRVFINERNGKYYADLKRLNYSVLCEIGIKPENIDVSDKCTRCEPNEFFSHRYHGNRRGTMCAMISLPVN